MGYGLGAAIGAKTARPDATVVNVAGDGSFRMNCAELATLSHYKIPVVELIFNNRTLGMVRQWQKLFYGSRFSQTDVDPDIDYAKLAEAFGVKAYRIKTKSDIEPVLREALSLRKARSRGLRRSARMKTFCRWFRRANRSKTRS